MSHHKMLSDDFKRAHSTPTIMDHIVRDFGLNLVLLSDDFEQAPSTPTMMEHIVRDYCLYRSSNF